MSRAVRVFASFAIIFLGSCATLAFSQSGTDRVPSTADVPQCNANHHPTGCAAPYATCAHGPLKVDATHLSGAISSCQKEANHPRCPEFTWEKCCLQACFGLGGATGTEVYGACLNNCMNTNEAQIFAVPGANPRGPKLQFNL